MPKDGNKIKLVSGFRQGFGKSKTSINHKPWRVEMEKNGCGYTFPNNLFPLQQKRQY